MCNRTVHHIIDVYPYVHLPLHSFVPLHVHLSLYVILYLPMMMFTFLYFSWRDNIFSLSHYVVT